MSYDRKIDFNCPHILREEALFLEDGAQIVKPIRPLASANSLKVRLNRLIDAPSTGVYTPATIRGTKRAPFTILPGANTLVLDIGGAQHTIAIPPGREYSGDHFTKVLAPLLAPHHLVPQIRNGKLCISTAYASPAAKLVVLGGGAATALNFPIGRVWTGATIVPGWSLVQDPTALADRPARYIVFDEPLKGYRDFVELDYATHRVQCPRCGGIGVENDWRYGRNGDTIEARDEALLLQEFQKFLYTVRGSNPFHAWYGTSLIELIGSKITSGFTQTLIQSQITEAFRTWQGIKRQQEEKVSQVVTDPEFPYSLTDSSIEQSQQDPTVFFVTVTLHSRSNRQVEIFRGVKIPEPTDLLGSTAQEGVYRRSLTDYSQVG